MQVNAITTNTNQQIKFKSKAQEEETLLGYVGEMAEKWPVQISLGIGPFLFGKRAALTMLGRFQEKFDLSSGTLNNLMTLTAATICFVVGTILIGNGTLKGLTKGAKASWNLVKKFH